MKILILFLSLTFLLLRCSNNDSANLEKQRLLAKIDSLEKELKKFDFGYWVEGIGITPIELNDNFAVNDTIRTLLRITALLEKKPLLIRSDSATESPEGFTQHGQIDTIQFDYTGDIVSTFIPKSSGKHKQYYRVIANTRNGKTVEPLAKRVYNVVEKKISK